MKPTRCNFLQVLGISAASLGVSTPSTAAIARPPKMAKPSGDEQILFVGDNIAVANTEYGKVRGFILRVFISFWENLARLGNVVFCSLNHRLGALGYTDLKAAGGHAASGNVGNLDMVAALEWVKNNIAHFGGDPNNVTIIGQSGGGAKVTTLMNMPSAKGLFHKAVALSGSSLAGTNKEYAEKLGLKVMEEAGHALAKNPAILLRLMLRISPKPDLSKFGH